MTPSVTRHRPGLGVAPAGLVDVDDALSANEGARLLEPEGRGHFLFQPADGTQRHLQAEASDNSARMLRLLSR